MTSIDLYQHLIKDVQPQFLPSDRHSQASNSLRQDEFELILVQARKTIQTITQTNGDILRLKDRLMTITDSQKQSKITQQIKNKCDCNYLLITQLRQQLTKSGSMIEQLKEESPDEPETFSKIFRRRHLAEQIDRIIGQTFSIQKLVQKYSIQTNLKRIRLILPDASEEEAKQLAASSKGFQQAVSKRVTSQVSKKWIYTYNDIMNKNEGIKTLQNAVAENLRLIKQVLSLVQKQGQMIDNILENVTKAKDYVIKAQKVLEKKKEEHKSSRKKICCIIFLALAVLTLIATPIIIKVVQERNASN